MEPCPLPKCAPRSATAPEQKEVEEVGQSYQMKVSTCRNKVPQKLLDATL